MTEQNRYLHCNFVFSFQILEKILLFLGKFVVLFFLGMIFLFLGNFLWGNFLFFFGTFFMGLWKKNLFEYARF